MESRNGFAFYPKWTIHLHYVEKNRGSITLEFFLKPSPCWQCIKRLLFLPPLKALLGYFTAQSCTLENKTLKERHIHSVFR